MKSTSQQDTWSVDLQLSTSHGFLKHEILERICRLLPTQQDCYQACLINRAWRYTATNVLWESPVFRTPHAFKTFVKIIDEKRLALNVKHLTLCLPDTISSTLFEPVNQYDQDRHADTDNILSRPNVIQYVVQYCAQLTSLTIYGWQLGQHEFNMLYSFLPCLKNLKVIGSSDKLLQVSQQNQQTYSTFHLNTYLPRLSQLVLDGLFPISKSFAQSIAVKAQNMTTLHLSLSSMNAEILSLLCTSDTALDLKDLTLTHGTHMNDNYTSMVLARFSNLRKFRMEGTQHLTANILQFAVWNCQYLQHLEIRQTRPGEPLNDGSDQDDWQLPNTEGTDIRTLLLENLHLYNKTLDNIASYCPLLTSLGLSHTGTDLTDEGIEAIRMARFGFLRHIHLEDCPMVTSEAMASLPMPSLYTLHLESIDNIEPIDIFKICLQTVDDASKLNLPPNLRRIRVVGHENIAKSVVGTHALEQQEYEAKQWEDENATEDPLVLSNYQVTLDQQAIDALAHSDDFIVMPSNKYLTGHQIVELARKLQVPLDHLVSVLDELKEPETKHISEPEEPKSRVDILKNSTPKSIRPSTPALWAAAINDPDNVPPQQPHVSTASDEQMTLSSPLQPENHSVSTTSDAVSSQSQESSQSQVSSQSQTSEDEYDQAIDEKENWVDMEMTESNKNISLGGWGTSNTIPWAKQKSRSFSNVVVAGTSSVKSSQIVKASNNGNSNGVDWGNTTEENYESYWRTTPVEEPPQLSRQRGKLTNLNVGSDQWGQASKYVNWKDTEPFVGDVLDGQSNTVYWEQRDGKWKPLKPVEQLPTSNDTVSKNRTDTGAERKPTTTRFSTGTTPSSSFSKRPSSNSKQISNSQVDAPSITFNNSPRRTSLIGNGNGNDTKDYTLSSDDSDVDWDDDDGITININSSGNIHQQARTLSSTRESKWSSTQANKSSWNDKKDWGNIAGGDKKYGQESPVANGLGLNTSDASDGTKHKPIGREPRTTRFARPRSVSTAFTPGSGSPGTLGSPVTSVASSVTITPANVSAYTPLATTDSAPNSCPTKLWQEFADNKKGKVAATNPSSLMMTGAPTTSSNSTEEDLTTELLVDTSDSTAVVGTTTWTPKEERSSLHDLYNSMADIQINGDKDDTMEKETIYWSDETNGQQTDQGDRWTINRDHISKVDTDAVLLLLESSLDLESSDSKNNEPAIKPKNMEFASPPLLDTAQSMMTTPIKLGNGSPAQVPSLLDDLSPTTLSNVPMEEVVQPLSTSNDLVPSSSDTITDMPATYDTTMAALINPASTDSPESDYNPPFGIPTTGTTVDSPDTDTDEFLLGSSRTNVKEEPFMKLGLQTPNGLQEILYLYEHQDPRINVHQFCKQNGMLSSEDYIFENANKKYLEKKANILLGGMKKKKKKKKDKKEGAKNKD